MFVSNGDLIFDRVEEKVSKNGKPYSLVHIIDPKNYQRLEFFADNDLSINCGQNAKCKVTLKCNRMGYSTSMNCLAVNAI